MIVQKGISFLSSIGIFGTAALAQTDQKSNIILVIIDDLGYSQISCNGNPFYSTPNIDKMASEGIRFTNAYSACAVSSPTRASIFTGKYPARLHLTNFIPGHLHLNGTLQQPEWQKYLKPEEKTIAEIAVEKGYRTGLFGKWHLAPDYTGDSALLFGPDKHGFQESKIYHKPSDKDIKKGIDDVHNTAAITRSGCDFIRKHASEPFFLVLTHNTIHAPIHEVPALIAKHKSKSASGRKDNNSVIAAMMETLDNQMAVLMGTLKETNLHDKTMILFVSDNGGFLSDAAQDPLRAGKGFYYEGGIRVPMIAWHPSKIKPGICHYPVISTDIFYTLASMMGMDRFDVNDGYDISSILFKNNVPTDERTLFWHYPHYHNTGMTPGGAMRKGNIKLIVWYEKMLNGEKAYELYDISKDVSEKNDISDMNPKIAKEMFSEFQQWLKETNAQMPIKK